MEKERYVLYSLLRASSKGGEDEGGEGEGGGGEGEGGDGY
jgi:hypothetical protein